MKRAISVVFCLAVLSSCGYSIRKPPFEVRSVRLVNISNMTYEPKLSDRLTEALSISLLKNGIKVDDRSSYRVEGSIGEFRLKGIAEKDDITISFEVVIGGSFYLIGPETRTPLRGRNTFIVTFTSEEALEKVMALKEEAVERALSDMADEIVASIIHQR